MILSTQNPIQSAQNAPRRCRCGVELAQPATGRPRTSCSDACRRADDADAKRARRAATAAMRSHGEQDGILAAAGADKIAFRPVPDQAREMTEAESLRAAAEWLHDSRRPAVEREAAAKGLIERFGYQLLVLPDGGDRRYMIARG